MIEPQHGFAIDDVEYRWGTLPGDIAGMEPLRASIGYLHRSLPCRSVLGLDAAGVMLSMPASDRPVMTVTYELAPPSRWDGKPDRWVEALRTRLGPAATVRRDKLKDYRDPSAGVACWASWHRPGLDIHLSIYGGVRSNALGPSAGLISLGWTDTIAAATPFVPAWRATSDALETSARQVASFQRFDVPEDIGPAFRGREADSADMYAAQRALYNRGLHATPQAIRDRLDSRSFALWQSATDGQWLLSSLLDSVTLRDARVAWRETKPAKGGGESELAVGSWSVRMAYGTAAIAAAAAALKALPGVVVELYESYDV